MSNFRIGQKVVCVYDGWNRPSRGEIFPKVGNVYTIRDIIAGRFNPQNTYLRLVEIVNPVIQYDLDRAEAQFNVEAFRPAVERKTDISIFTKILDGPRLRETALTKGEWPK